MAENPTGFLVFFILLLLSLLQFPFYLCDSGSYASCWSLFPFLGDFTILKFHNSLSVKIPAMEQYQKKHYILSHCQNLLLSFLQCNTISLYLLTSIMSYIWKHCPTHSEQQIHWSWMLIGKQTSAAVSSWTRALYGPSIQLNPPMQGVIAAGNLPPSEQSSWI